MTYSTNKMARLLFVVLFYILANIGYSHAQTDTYTHECARECSWPSKPKTCRYVFTLEWRLSMSGACVDCPFNMTDCYRPGCVPVNGVTRPIIVVNRQMPGPQIQVCEDDTVEVKVWNRLGNSDGTTIHWHGFHQRGTNIMDGPAMISQCPITPESSFTYKFKAHPVGTHWWHSHSNFQRIDGSFGAFVIHQAPDRDPNSDLYDYDLPEHVVFVQAWPDLPSTPIGETPGQRTAPTINAKGQFKAFVNDNNETVYTPREVFEVKKGQRYRFRLIGNNNCHMYISVDGHSLTAIATDGAPIKPISVDRIGVASGETYDFVLAADQDVGNYWFRVEIAEGFYCRNGPKEEYAILRYEGAPEEDPDEDPEETPAEDDNDLILNPKSLETPNGINLVDVESLVPDDEKLLGEPDQRLYLQLGWSDVSPQTFDPQDYPHPIPIEPGVFTTHMNFVSFKFPPSPLLTQYDDIPEEEFCSVEENLARREECTKKFCACLQKVKIGLGETVELVLVSEGSEHPMHIHGYTFRVVSSGKIPKKATVEDVMEWDKQGDIITRNLEGAVLKDTVPMENNAYYIVRFVADNPGQWPFHCHDIFHNEYGMSMVITVGEPTDIPPIPDDFPRCGSWSKRAEEIKKERKNGESDEPIKPAEKPRKKPTAK